MTSQARFMSGIILITVPTIQYGGYFLLRSLTDRTSGYMDNALRQNFFRAGHAHAGVIVILSLISVVGRFCRVTRVAAVVGADWSADFGDSYIGRILRLSRSSDHDRA
jgi:Ni,Fe-hydrogenase I cytochrome b subunit